MGLATALTVLSYGTFLNSCFSSPHQRVVVHMSYTTILGGRVFGIVIRSGRVSRIVVKGGCVSDVVVWVVLRHWSNWWYLHKGAVSLNHFRSLFHWHRNLYVCDRLPMFPVLLGPFTLWCLSRINLRTLVGIPLPIDT